MEETKAPAPSIDALHAHQYAFQMQTQSPPTHAAHSAAWYAQHCRAPGTLKSLNVWWRLVLELCDQWQRWPLPMEPVTAACVVAEMADRGYEWGSIRLARSTIREAHRLAGEPDPTAAAIFLDVFDGISRTLGTQSKYRKLAIVATQLRRIAQATRERPQPHGILEWAVLALGYYGALRRSELVALDVTDVHIDATGMRILIAMSKTDRYGRTEEILVDRVTHEPAVCAVAALEAWLAVLGQVHGPLFRRILPGDTLGGRLSDRSVCRYVQRYAGAIGEEPSKFGAHSLRAGCVTQMKLSGLDDVAIAAHTRHHSLESLQTYYRPGDHPLNLAKLLLP